MFQKGKSYNRRNDIHNQYGGNIQSGIAPSAQYPYVFLFKTPRGEEFGYQDGWTSEGQYLYTGEGPRGDMEFVRGNRALREHRRNGKSLQLFEKRNSGYYEYLGEFEYVDHDIVTGPDEEGEQRKVIRFRLEEVMEDDSISDFVQEEEGDYNPPKRVESTRDRIVRDTEQGKRIKRLYDNECQVCGIRLEVSNGFYVESAHIRPLGGEHKGSDSPENIICLCPNHHVLFDNGGFSIADDFSLVGIEGKLTVHQSHKIGLQNVQYHRLRYLESQQ